MKLSLPQKKRGAFLSFTPAKSWRLMYFFFCKYCFWISSGFGPKLRVLVLCFPPDFTKLRVLVLCFPPDFYWKLYWKGDIKSLMTFIYSPFSWEECIHCAHNNKNTSNWVGPKNDKLFACKLGVRESHILIMPY
jgi:hypothetical protein